MDAKVFDHGTFIIKDKILKIKDLTINLSNLDNIYKFEYERYSIFSNIKEWFYGLVIIFIICCIWSKLSLLFTIYLFSIIVLLCFNFNENKKRFFGLRIITNNMAIELKSDNVE